MSSLEVNIGETSKSLSAIFGKARGPNQISTSAPIATAPIATATAYIDRNNRPTIRQFTRNTIQPIQQIPSVPVAKPEPIVRPASRTFSNKAIKPIRPITKSYAATAIGTATVRVYAKNSLAYHLVNLRHDIDERITNADPDELPVGIAERYDMVKVQWSDLMEKLIGCGNNLDKICAQLSSYDHYKRILLDKFLVISLSFIVIGPDEKRGSGIDNFWRPLYTLADTIDCSVNVKINQFIELLPDLMHEICPVQKLLDECHGMHRRLLKERDNHISKISLQENSIKLLQSERKKSPIDKPDDLFRAELETIQLNIRSLREKLKNTDSRITKEIDTKASYQMQIGTMLRKVIDIIDFNYFSHDDYVSMLDHRIALN